MAGVSRRRFLQLTAGAAAAAVGSSCSTGSDPTGDDDGDGIANSDETTTTLMSAQKRSRLSDVQHVVILIQGGASFDQVFGTREGVRGFTDPDVLTLPSGKPIWNQPDPTSADGWVLPFPIATAAGDRCIPLLSDGWDAQHGSVDAGSMDRFAIEYGPQTMGYYQREDLPFYASLADEFTVCDSWFSSVLGPGNPNRLEAMTGTIDPLAKAGGPATGPFATTYAWETYPERLERAGISWRVYHDAGSRQNNALAAFIQFQEAAEGSPLWDGAMKNRSVAQFETDCADGTLPWVSWVVAPDSMTGTPEQQQFAARHLAAITANPDLWAHTLVVLTHAGNGGYFDHVPPPTPPIENLDEYVGLQPIGFGARVPALVVSPWTRGGRVNSDVLDHTSILRLLEHRFGVVAPLISRWRRETAGDLLDVLDFGSYDPSVPAIAEPLPVPVSRVPAPNGACTSEPLAAPAKQSLPVLEG